MIAVVKIDQCEHCGGRHTIDVKELYALRVDFINCVDEIKICCPSTGRSMVLHTDKN